MGLRGWAVPGLLMAAAGWWYWPLSPRVPAAPVITLREDAIGASNTSARCPPPARSGSADAPLQSPVPAAFPSLAAGAAKLMPLAGFSLQATVLSRRDYATGREADYSPTDLALGWGRMQDQAVLSRLDIDQSGRWYHYRWSGEPPIAPEQIALSSANMHMIPADAGIAAALHRVQRGDRVRIEGWLVQVDGPDGWHWRSSLSREDTGAGACELVYVCTLARL